jgi:hypothetical protein
VALISSGPGTPAVQRQAAKAQKSRREYKPRKHENTKSKAWRCHYWINRPVVEKAHKSHVPLNASLALVAIDFYEDNKRGDRVVSHVD